jgi:hypothetical protein
LGNGNKINTEGGGYSISTSAQSVFVSGNDVYVAGYENGREDGSLRFWKNGVEQSFPDDSRWGEANSIYILGNDIYVTGSKTWKNGEVLYEDYGYGNSIFVSGGDVYVAGRREHGAVLWKNGIAEELSGAEGGGDAMANSVFVSDNDVYVAGWKGFFHDNGTAYLIAILWKNGEEIELTAGNKEAEANSVFVSGNDVYVAGYENTYVSTVDEETGRIGTPHGTFAVLWKNGVPQYLTDGVEQAWANSVYVFGSDVYVAGFENGVAKLWKNGVEQELVTKGRSSSAYSVFVK